MRTPAPLRGILMRSPSAAKWTVKGHPHITVWTLGPTRGWQARNSKTGEDLFDVNRYHLTDQIKERWLEEVAA